MPNCDDHFDDSDVYHNIFVLCVCMFIMMLMLFIKCFCSCCVFLCDLFLVCFVVDFCANHPNSTKNMKSHVIRHLLVAMFTNKKRKTINNKIMFFVLCLKHDSKTSVRNRYHSNTTIINKKCYDFCS